MKICVHRRGYSWYVWHAMTCTHIDLSICPYVYRVRSAVRSWKYVNNCQFRWQKYVFTQIDTVRFVYLHVSIPPAKPVLSEHCRAPVLQQQPPHRAAMHVTEATRGLNHGQTHYFRGLGAARDAKNAQQGTVCGTLSSHWPLWFCLQIWMCCWEPAWATAAARELFCGKARHFRAHNFRGLGAARDTRNAQQDTVS